MKVTWAPVLLIKATEYQETAGVNLESHGEIVGDPIIFVLDVYYIPYIFLDVVILTDVGYLLRWELDGATENLNKLSVENQQEAESLAIFKPEILTFRLDPRRSTRRPFLDGGGRLGQGSDKKSNHHEVEKRLEGVQSARELFSRGEYENRVALKWSKK